MLQFSTIFILMLYFTFSISTDTDKSSLKLTSNNNDLLPKRSHQQLVKEHLKVIIIIGTISIGIMIIIVTIIITITYFHNKKRHASEVTEQTKPLNPSKQNAAQTAKTTPTKRLSPV